MRVELVYAPGCTTYKKALHVLETVIAEEGLPIAIEMTEDHMRREPAIRINGLELGEPSHEFEGDPCFISGNSKLVGSGLPCAEQLRCRLSDTWKELTSPFI